MRVMLGCLTCPVLLAQGAVHESDVQSARELVFECSVLFTCPRIQAAEASSDRIDLPLRAPCNGIGNPAVDVRFMPTCTVGADLELSRERALGDLAVDGGPGQPGPGEDGFKRMMRSGSHMAAPHLAGCF